MNSKTEAKITKLNESPQTLASELVHYGFISEDDCQKIAVFLENALHKDQTPLH
ncbi:nuclear receptor-binding 2 [Pelobates cultripes]|uniref:Nuclear receptor-binding 2 n=1 Tax=Pelobates cultripes TaxID=61616 RepID=A0AAD1S730_PELCU|nr:nuclear receptor-binding 2 [Pelobates cultripes]